MLPKHTQYARKLGILRLTDARLNRRDNVGHRPNDDKEKSYVSGACFEMAFYLWLGGKESGAQWFTYINNASREQLTEQPDINYRGCLLEIKAAPINAENCYIRADSVNLERVYVVGSIAKYPNCIFFGRMPGDEIKQRRIGGRDDIPAHLIHPIDLGLRDCEIIRRLPVLIRGHRCFCGEYGAFGYGPPGWPAPEKWYCSAHRYIAESRNSAGT